MARIQISELEKMYSEVQVNREETVNNHLHFLKKEIDDFENYEELSGKAWKQAKEYFNAYSIVIESIKNLLNRYDDALKNYQESLESKIGNPEEDQIDTEEKDEYQNELNNVQREKMI